MRLVLIVPSQRSLLGSGARALSAYLRRRGHQVRLLFLPADARLSRDREGFLLARYRLPRAVRQQVVELCGDAQLVGLSLLTCFWMGLANLVPGISGGTMILAVGLYDRFIGAVADVTRLRLRRESLLFLAVLGFGLVLAIVSLSGVAVSLVSSHRWAMYSLFVGLTLGGVPALARLSRPWSAGVFVAGAVGMAAMAALAWGLSGTSLPATVPMLAVVGAAAASSMILPGVSGSYVLLILGMYDLVIGSLSAGALREDPAGSAAIIVPVVVGAVLGVGLLSNVLRWLLRRQPSISHGALLGLLCGSVFGLWPFQEARHPDLAHRPTRKALTMVLDGADHAAVRAKYGDELTDEKLEELAATWAARKPSELVVKSTFC